MSDINLNNLTEQEQLEVIRKNAYLFRKINNPSDAVKLLAVKKYGGNIEYIKNPPYDLICEAIKHYEYPFDNTPILKILNKPSEDVECFLLNFTIKQILKIKKASIKTKFNFVLKETYYALNHDEKESVLDDIIEEMFLKRVKKIIIAVKNKSQNVKNCIFELLSICINEFSRTDEKFILFALGKCGELIQYIVDPSFEMQEAAVKNNPLCITYIKTPFNFIENYCLDYINHSLDNLSNEEKLNRINSNPSLIKYVNNPSIELQIAAVKSDPTLISIIEDPDEKVQLIVYKKDPACLEYVEFVNEKLQVKAIKEDAYNLTYIKNPCDKAIELAIEQEPRNIGLVKNPSVIHQFNAIKLSGAAIDYIENPDEDAIKLHESLYAPYIRK